MLLSIFSKEWQGLSFFCLRRNNKAYSETPKKGNTMKTFETALIVLPNPKDSEYENVIPPEQMETKAKVKAFLDTLNLS